MKGNEKLIDTLNSPLADELTAFNQYMVHSEMIKMPKTDVITDCPGYPSKRIISVKPGFGHKA